MEQFINEIEKLVSNKLEQFKTIGTMVKLEARLAGLSVFPLLLNIVMLLVIVMAIWLSSMSLIGYAALLLFNNFLIALGVIFFINIGCLVGLLKYLSFNLNNISFKKTRDFIAEKKEG